MIVVADTSAISVLLRIGEIRLLHEIFGEVVIPEEVRHELARTFSHLPAWIYVEQIKDPLAVENFKLRVHRGEAAAIQLAIELSADRLLIDDFKGRQLAQSEGIHIIGLLGVVLFARSKGLIPSARHILNRLQSETNFYLAERIKEAALASIGE